MISGLPLAALAYLLPAARDWEQQEVKAAAEKRLFPIWFAQKTLHEVAGGKGDFIKYSDFIGDILERGAEHTERNTAAPPRSGEDILKDFMPLIEADRGRGSG
jgi:hypothetical protein